MLRTGLGLGAAVAVLLGAGWVLAGDEGRLRGQLAMQAAFEEGVQHLQGGRFAEAVAVLEKRIGLIDGNRRYLEALRDAYRGHIKALLESNRQAEAKRYQDRLAILEPGPRREPPARPGRPGGIIPRAKAADDEPRTPDDPFADSNRADAPSGSRARSLAAQAETAYRRKEFTRAGDLYALAHRLAPESVAEFREHWAYCRLHAVALALNRGAVENAAELEREVRQARQMSPLVEGWARTLLARLAEPGGPSVEVRHTPRPKDGWAVAQTPNFRIYHADSNEKAEKVARVAEATRLAMLRKWFGEITSTWTPVCVIYLHPTAQGYARAAEATPESPGHSRMKLQGERVLERRIDLPADNPNMLTVALPHEITHVVLAGRFGEHQVPRWADVGMALLSEPTEQVQLHVRNLPRHQSEGTLFSTAELLRQADWPEARRISAFYAQSVSLVDFLCTKKDPTTFARFLREALDSGCDKALQRHYGYRNPADLESDWKQHAFGGGAVTAVTEKRR